MRDTPRPGGAGGWQPPPRGLVVVGGVVLAAATAMAVVGALRTGVTTDEPIHVMRLRNFFDTGWYALDWDYGGAGPGSEGTNTYVYAPVAMLLLHGWSVLWGVDGWHVVATSSHAYQVRHVGVVVIGVVGMAGVVGIGRVLLRSWRWGLVCAAVLAATPMWTGHIMFNVKDVPVATGHTLCTLGLLLFVRDRPPGWGLRVARGAILVGGLVLTLGTRPGMWSGIAVLLMVGGVGVVFALPTARAVLASLAELVVACGVAAAALVAIYPSLFAHPGTALRRTSESSSSFLAGEKADRWYVPTHLTQEMPTLLLLFAVAGLLVATLVLLRHPRTQWVFAARLALVGAQALTLPLAAVVLGSDLYHGLRQLLFAIPAIAVLAGCGMAWLLARPTAFGRRLVPLAAGLALVLPTIDQVGMQPYQTTYVNLATDVLFARDDPPDARPGGDFWRVSIPELVAQAPLDRQLLCKAKTGEETGVAYSFTNGGEAFSTSRSLDCREEVNGPLAPAGLSVSRPLPVRDFDAVFIGEVPTNCAALAEVSRWRHGFDIVLTTLARCTIDPATLSRSPVRVDDPALGSAEAGDLWLYATDGWLQWPGDLELTSPVPEAGVAFRPDRSCRTGCTLVVSGRGPRDVVARVNGAPVEIRRRSGSILVPVTAAQAADDVWVSLARSSRAPLGVRMTGLSLEPGPAHTPTRGLT